MDVDNINNLTKLNPVDQDQTTNIHLNLTINKTDDNLWEVMVESSFELLEKVISPRVNGKHKVEYWHGSPDVGEWLPRSLLGHKFVCLVQFMKVQH